MKKIIFNEMKQKMKSDARTINENINIDVHDGVLNNISQLSIKQRKRSTTHQGSLFSFKWLLPLGVAASAIIILSLNYTDSIKSNSVDNALVQQEQNRIEHQALKQDIQYLSQIFAL